MKITDTFNITHQIEGEFKNEEISAEELHQFACEVLADLYSQHGCSISLAEISPNPFNKVFVVQEAGICYVVRTKLPNVENDNTEDFFFVKDFARKYNFSPRLITGIFYDYYGCGVWAYRGSNYALRFEVDTLFEFDENIEYSETSERELVYAFFLAWREMDVSYIEKHLHPKFKYSSDWVFDIIPSKFEFIHYLKGKFQTLKNHDITPDVELIEVNNKPVLKFNQNDEMAYLDIIINNGYVTEASLLKELPKTYFKNE
jgi:hypothetical protein